MTLREKLIAIMKSLVRSAIVTIATLILPLASHGQCATLETRLATCQGSNGCSQSVPINFAVPAEFGYYVGNFQVACCDQYFFTNTEESVCDGDVARAQIPRRPLAAVASLQPLLIRNCAGGYDPYSDPAGSSFDVQKALNSHTKIALN